jgi:hypothetical protein
LAVSAGRGWRFQPSGRLRDIARNTNFALVPAEVEVAD